MQKNKSSISGLWKNIYPICANHEEEVKLEVTAGSKGIYYYECPICKKINRIPLKEYERTVDMLIEKLMDEDRICLKGFAWQKNFISYEVKEHNVKNDCMTIAMMDVKKGAE